tara:strand:- start:6045 stop:6359 length:315 start_codon:yes stop_codon:yes gene_type:complete
MVILSLMKDCSLISTKKRKKPCMKTIAQITYIPLYTDHPKEIVQDLIEFVAQHDVEVDVNYLSTSVKGETDVVFDLIREIYEEMTLEDEKFRLHVELLSPVDEE